MTPDRWAEAERCYLAALELPPAERPAFLDQACAPDVRAQVEQLLSGDDCGAAMLQRIVADTALSWHEQRGDFGPGQRIGPYRVVRETGQGGMGTVYEAVRDDDQFRQRVAIKVVSRGMESGFLLERFRQERQLLADLEHPNIARLLDGGATDQGLPYFAMEYLEGRPLSEYCRDLDVRAKLGLFLQVCAAVEFAHRKLIVHRDIKPANVLVTADGIPKLLDFGIAKLVDEVAGDAPRFSGAATPEYASPEQIRGDRATTASDIYSLGALLYHLLCGRPPHRFSGRSLDEIERTLREEAPASPSAITPQVARDLDEIVLKALRHAPAERYSSVEKFAEDIRRFLGRRPIQAHEREVKDQVMKFLSRHRLGVTGATALLITALAAAGAVLYQARVAERRFNQMRGMADQFLFEFDAMQDVPGSTQARGIVVRKALGYLEAMARESRGDPTLLADVAASYERVGQIQGDPLHSNLGDSAGALASYRKAVSILEGVTQSRRAAPAASIALIEAYDNLANLQKYTHDIAGSVETFRKAQKLAQARFPADSIDPMLLGDLSALYVDMSRALEYRGDITGALDASRRAVDVERRRVALDPKDHASRSSLADSLANLGGRLIADGKPREALDFYRQNLTIRLELISETPRSIADRRNLMLAYSRMGDILSDPKSPELDDRAAALDNCRRMLSIAKGLVADDPFDQHARFDLAMSYLRTGAAAAAAGNRNEAIEDYQKSLDLERAMAAADPKNSRLSNMEVYLEARSGKEIAAGGDLAGGIRHYRRAYILGRQLLAGDPGNVNNRTSFSLHFMEYIVLLGRSGDRNGATSIEPEVLKLAEGVAAQSTTPAAASRRPAVYFALGEVHEQLHESSQALAWYRRSAAAWQDLEQRGHLLPSYAAQSAAAARAVERLSHEH